MNCLIPPELDDEQLLAYLLDNAPIEVQQHLDQCPSCRSRLATLQGWQSWLTQNLYRTPCPSSLELGEYRLEMLSEEQRIRIEKHLALCPHCQREVQMFSLDEQTFELDSSVNPLQQVVEQVRIVVARLREELTGMQLQGSTMLAGMRGQQVAKSLTYTADELEISLQIQTFSAQSVQKMLLGWVSGQASDQQVAVYLWQGVKQIATTNIDDLGNFAFPALSPGQYDLALHIDTREIYVKDLAL